MSQLHLPRMQMWDVFARSHTSVLKLFFLYAVPLSLIPPVMLHYAGVVYSGELLPAMTNRQLGMVGIVFFLAELVMTFLVAYVIQRFGEVVDMKPAFEDAYKLAVVAPTPLWLTPLFLFIPSLIFNVTMLAAALMISGILIFYSVPTILRVEEKGHAMLLSGSILAAGTVAWAMMMYLTFFTWSIVTGSPLLR